MQPARVCKDVPYDRRGENFAHLCINCYYGSFVRLAQFAGVALGAGAPPQGDIKNPLSISLRNG